MNSNPARVLLAETALLAAGRRGAVGGLHLEKAGLATNARGNIDVNAHYQTHVRHIYAAGDVIGFPGARVDFHGTGARGDVPCLRFSLQAAARLAAAHGNLHDSGNFRGGRDRGILRNSENQI